MKYKLILIILTLLLSTGLIYANDKELIDSVDKLRNEVLPDNNTFQKEIESVYDNMSKRHIIPEVSIPNYDVFKGDQARIMESFNLPEAKNIIPGANIEESCLDPQKLGDYRVFVFISSSVPEVTLKNYMRDAVKLKDALLVIRGVIGSADFLKPTQDFITQISCGKKISELKPTDKCDISRVDINPLLFSLFGIDKAPAVVFSRLSYMELMVMANTGKYLTDDDYFILRGDTSISYALEKFEQAGAETNVYLKILQGSY